jgi:CheY-like chemotaxis protein
MGNGKTILLVEDDAFVSDIYNTKLTQEGYSVIIAENGLEAMKKLAEMTPNLILLDIVMPYMDGMEVLGKLKSEENGSKYR